MNIDSLFRNFQSTSNYACCFTLFDGEEGALEAFRMVHSQVIAALPGMKQDGAYSCELICDTENWRKHRRPGQHSALGKMLNYLVVQGAVPLKLWPKPVSKSSGITWSSTNYYGAAKDGKEI